MSAVFEVVNGRRIEVVPYDTECVRACGDAECPICGKTVYKHVLVLVANTNQLFLRRMCNGQYYKT